MKRFVLLSVLISLVCITLPSQELSSCEKLSIFDKSRKPDLGIILSSGDAETVWNGLRLAQVAQSKGDTVVIFVINKAVDVFINGDAKFDTFKLSRDLTAKNVDIYTCATCAKRRNTENVQMCTITSIYDMYDIIKNSKKVISF
jgi:sulfur relay (sulfurtransferase) complex TusBCD TusD component (DsrE family)